MSKCYQLVIYTGKYNHAVADFGGYPRFTQQLIEIGLLNCGHNGSMDFFSEHNAVAVAEELKKVVSELILNKAEWMQECTNRVSIETYIICIGWLLKIIDSCEN